MEDKYLLAMNKLKQYNQEQLFNCYDKLNEPEKNYLIEDILNTDFAQVKNLYESINQNNKVINEQIDTIPYTNKEKLSSKQINYYKEIGGKAIKQGEYAVVTMAGGQRYKART